MSSSMITSLPYDIIVHILARLPRCNYPYLSLVSKHFHSIVTSPEIYARRSLLGCTEAFIYTILYNQVTKEVRFYILRRKANNNNRLVLIPSLQAIPSFSNFFARGSKIYAIDGIYHTYPTIGKLSIVDCTSHMVQSLPTMPMPLKYTFANIVDEKIYATGGCNSEKKNVMFLFNTETQMWESEMTKVDMEIGYLWSCGSVVIKDKMYMRDSINSYVYIPKENKMETDEVLNLKRWVNACVIDDILYYYDSSEKKLRAYDSKQRSWEEVKGLESLPDAHLYPSWSNTVNYGDRLVLLFTRRDSDRRIWCAEITLERRQEGEIWGNIEWCDAVTEGSHFLLEKSLAVMI